MSIFWLNVLTVITGVGCGLMGGVFFAFSTFVMKALERLPTPQGVAAMQSINVVVIHPLFLIPFFGTGLAAVVVAIGTRGQPAGMALLAAGALYVVGTVGVTIVGNVPLNKQLALVDPLAPAAEAAWRSYINHWLPWNHVRTAAALAACAIVVTAR